MHIQINIVYTSKPCGNNQEHYTITHEESIDCKDMKEAKQILRDRYGKCKRSAMYRDKKDGSTYQVGYVFHYRDVDYDSHKKYFAQDWVSFNQITEVILKAA